MLALILWFPLVGFLGGSFFGRLLGRSVSKINYFCIFFTLLLGLVFLFFKSLLMVCVVSYTKEDPRIQRFMSYLSLFTFFMLTPGNFIQMLVGWVGVGVVSYFLVSFWQIFLNLLILCAYILSRNFN